MSTWRFVILFHFCKDLKWKKYFKYLFTIKSQIRSFICSKLYWISNSFRVEASILTMTCKGPTHSDPDTPLPTPTFLLHSRHSGLSVLHTPGMLLLWSLFNRCDISRKYFSLGYPSWYHSLPYFKSWLKCHLRNESFTDLSYLFLGLFPVPRRVPRIE